MSRNARGTIGGLLLAAAVSLVSGCDAYLGAVAPAKPAPAPYQIGDAVTLIHDCDQRTESGAAEKLSSGATFRVQDVNGGWLLVSGNVDGWIRADDVIPVERATAYFTEQIEHAPADPHNYYFRAGVLQMQHQYDKSLADYDEAIRLDPSEPAYYTECAVCLIAMKDYARAADELTSVIKRQPGNKTALIARGIVYAETGHYAAAYRDWAEAARLAPSDIPPRANVAELLACCPDATLRNGPQAVQLATALCEETGWRQPQLLHYLACGYAECGDFASAVKWEQRAIELYSAKQVEDLEKLRAALTQFESHQPLHQLTSFGS